MKPQIKDIVEKEVVKYPHLFWTGRCHSKWCWCRNPECNPLNVKNLIKDGSYYWSYAEGEALMDGGA